MTEASTFGIGQMSPSDAATEFNVLSFVIKQALGRLGTMKIVKVVAVTNSGGVSPAGTVDVQPLVNQVDGAGNAVPHGIVHGLPYLRIQGGANAVIIDPVVGDIGLAVISDRDISAVKASKKASNPGSARQFSLSDGVYVGGIINAAPTQHVQFNSDGVHVVSTTKVEAVCAASSVVLTPESLVATIGAAKVTMTASNLILQFGALNITIDSGAIRLNGPVIFNGLAGGVAGTIDFGGSILQTTGAANVGSVASSGDVTAEGKSLATHVHPGVQPGGGTTGPPA